MPLAGCAGTNGLRQNVNREIFFGGGRCKEQRMASTVAKKLRKTSYCEVVWGQPRHARYAALLYIYFNSQHFFFLTISVPFTSVTASSKRHLCFVQTWCETPLFRYMKKKAVSILFPFWKQKWGLMRKKKLLHNVVMTSPAQTKKRRGPLDIKRRKWTGPQLARHDCNGRSCLLTFSPMHFRKWLRVWRLAN